MLSMQIKSNIAEVVDAGETISSVDVFLLN